MLHFRLETSFCHAVTVGVPFVLYFAFILNTIDTFCPLSIHGFLNVLTPWVLHVVLGRNPENCLNQLFCSLMPDVSGMCYIFEMLQ